VGHTVTQADIDAGGIANNLTFTAQSPANTPFSDVSDDGIDDDGNVVDDPAELPIAVEPGREVTDVLAETGSAVGDVVVYQISVENIGNVTLTNLTVTDTMTDLAGNSSVSEEVIFVAGNDPFTLDVGKTILFEMTYTLTQEDLDAGGLVNVARADVVTTAGRILSDKSDNGVDVDVDGNTVDDHTVLIVNRVSSI